MGTLSSQESSEVQKRNPVPKRVFGRAHDEARSLVMEYAFSDEQIDRAVGSVGLPEDSSDFDRVLTIRLREIMVLEDVKELVAEEGRQPEASH